MRTEVAVELPPTLRSVLESLRWLGMGAAADHVLESWLGSSEGRPFRDAAEAVAQGLTPGVHLSLDGAVGYEDWRLTGLHEGGASFEVRTETANGCRTLGWGDMAKRWPYRCRVRD